MLNVIISGCRTENPERLGISNSDVIPWVLKSDMVYFYKNTVDHVVIMGHGTWKSIPINYRPLDRRINIVLSKTKKLSKVDSDISDTYFTDNIFDAIQIANCVAAGKDIFVIGGATVLEELITNPNYSSMINKLYVTIIDVSHKCNKYFPLGLYTKILPVRASHEVRIERDIMTDVITTFQSHIYMRTPLV